ncbi:XK-related protein, partial [Caligus rogercresseyi]
ENFSICDNSIRGGDRTPDQVEMLRERSKQYLAMHLILGGAILGMSIGIIAMLINFTDIFVPLESTIIFNETYMNSSIFRGWDSYILAPLCSQQLHVWNRAML